MLTQEPETIYCVIDNRVLALGIDERYRHYMTELEAVFLLPFVEVIAAKLGVKEKEVPVEGYYSEDPKLTSYFKLMRALQDVSESSLPLVEGMTELQRVLEVVSSPIFGKPERNQTLLPQGRDPLSRALIETPINQWTPNTLTNTAYEIAMESGDISLIGLAARLKDSILITALRETVILYAQKEIGSLGPKLEFIWRVENEFAEIANQFIEEFNNLLPKDSYLSHGIDKAEPQNAWRFYSAYADNKILGRCANLGSDRSLPTQYYHWAISRHNDQPILDDFWSNEIWPTERYKSEQQKLGWKLLRNELAKR